MSLPHLQVFQNWMKRKIHLNDKIMNSFTRRWNGLGWNFSYLKQIKFSVLLFEDYFFIYVKNYLKGFFHLFSWSNEKCLVSLGIIQNVSYLKDLEKKKLMFPHTRTCYQHSTVWKLRKAIVKEWGGKTKRLRKGEIEIFLRSIS